MIVTGSSGRMLGEVMCRPFMVMMRVVLWVFFELAGGHFVRAHEGHLRESMPISLLPFLTRLMRITVVFRASAITAIVHTPNDGRCNEDGVQLLLGIPPKAVRYKFTTCQEREPSSTASASSCHVLPAAAPCREGSGERLRQVSPSHLRCCSGI